MTKTPMWVGITFLIYWIALLSIVMGGTMYAVFALGHSGWWLLAAFAICGCGYQPHKWHAIYTGKEPPKEEAQ